MTHFHVGWNTETAPSVFLTRDDAVEELCDELRRVSQQIRDETGDDVRTSADTAMEELRNGIVDLVEVDECAYWISECNGGASCVAED